MPIVTAPRPSAILRLRWTLALAHEADGQRDKSEIGAAVITTPAEVVMAKEEEEDEEVLAASCGAAAGRLHKAEVLQSRRHRPPNYIVRRPLSHRHLCHHPHRPVVRKSSSSAWPSEQHGPLPTSVVPHPPPHTVHSYFRLFWFLFCAMMKAARPF